MGLFSKDIASMDDLFVHQLQDIYYAEKRIVGALPDMIAKASSPELKSAFEAHLGQTKEPREAHRAGVPNARRAAEASRLPRHRRHPRRG
jgi:hypothetical protein